MKDLTIIIPVHVFNEKLLKKAINSIPKNSKSKVVIVCPEDIANEINNIKLPNLNYEILVNTGETDVFTQINLAAKKCSTKFFSILEYDDIYINKWFDNIKVYTNYYDDISLFLPLIKLINYKDETISSLANELSWSSAFANENGFIDTDCLESYYDFFVSGGVFKTEDFNDLGGFKKSLSIASTYELLLRFAHNGKKIFVIPKIGYAHIFGNPESFSVKESEKISQKHGEWLTKMAQQEKYFNEDRNIIFEE